MRRILVVEDEPDVRASLRDLLADAFAGEVRVAGSVREARELLPAGPWQLLLCDERLPDGSGSALLGEAALAAPGARRVLMSAYHDLDAVLRGVNAAHIDYFVRKPFEPVELLGVVRALLGHPGNPARRGWLRWR